MKLTNKQYLSAMLAGALLAGMLIWAASCAPSSVIESNARVDESGVTHERVKDLPVTCFFWGGIPFSCLPNSQIGIK